MRQIIGISGRIGCGKNSAADYLIEHHGYTKFSFASTLKDVVAVIFGWSREMLEGDTPESRAERETVDQWWAERLGIPHLSPRWVLQYVGTEVFRHHFHADIWIAAIERKLKQFDGDVVITDCRLSNELALLRAMGAKLIRVERGAEPSWYQDAIRFNRGDAGVIAPVGIHESEYASVGFDYDYVLDNNGSLQDLHAMIRSIITLS